MNIRYMLKTDYISFNYINKIPKDLIESNLYREGADKYTKFYLNSIQDDENYDNERYVYLGTFSTIEENMLYNKEDFDKSDYEYYEALQDFENSLNHSEIRFAEDEYYLKYITDKNGKITIYNITSTEIAENQDYDLNYCMDELYLDWKFTENSTIHDEWAYKEGECIIYLGEDSNGNDIEVLADCFYNPHTGDFEIRRIDLVYTNVHISKDIYTKEELDEFISNNNITDFKLLPIDNDDFINSYKTLFSNLLK